MRISYIGGGTDYPEFFKDSPGGVIAAAINQYVYVYSNPLSKIAEENFRFTYRESESVLDHSQFRHPVLRAMLSHLKWDSRENMGTFADLPAGIGLGGSSAFTVAMAKLLVKSQDENSPQHLAQLAIHVERNLLGEPGGYQDQYVSAFGGLRAYDFKGINEVAASGNLLGRSEISYLDARQMLVWVGKTRNSSLHSVATVDSIKSKRVLLEETYEIYTDTVKAISNCKGDQARVFDALASAVTRGWKLKQNFTADYDENINHIINLALKNGVESLKLCGAGGSGFVLIMAEPQQLEELKGQLIGFKTFQPKIELEGAKLISNS
jgi:D-glycero-alpha-D-manno-heptose-7-phosphate kinase